MFGLGITLWITKTSNKLREPCTLGHIKRGSLDREVVIELTKEERSNAYSTIISSALDFAPRVANIIETDGDRELIEQLFEAVPKLDISLFQDGTLRDALYIWVANQDNEINVKALVSVLTKSLSDTDLYGNDNAINLMGMISTMTFMKGALDASLDMAGNALSNCPDINNVPQPLAVMAKALVIASTGNMLRTREIAYNFEKSCLSLDTDEFWKANF